MCVRHCGLQIHFRTNDSLYTKFNEVLAFFSSYDVLNWFRCPGQHQQRTTTDRALDNTAMVTRTDFKTCLKAALCVRFHIRGGWFLTGPERKAADWPSVFCGIHEVSVSLPRTMRAVIVQSSYRTDGTTSTSNCTNENSWNDWLSTTIWYIYHECFSHL